MCKGTCHGYGGTTEELRERLETLEANPHWAPLPTIGPDYNPVPEVVEYVTSGGTVVGDGVSYRGVVTDADEASVRVEHEMVWSVEPDTDEPEGVSVTIDLATYSVLLSKARAYDAVVKAIG